MIIVQLVKQRTDDIDLWTMQIFEPDMTLQCLLIEL